MRRRLIRHLLGIAYTSGWHDACSDHLRQRGDPTYPIGQGKKHGSDAILAELDPYDLLDLRRY
jgi:hypothetical protein